MESEEVGKKLQTVTRQLNLISRDFEELAGNNERLTEIISGVKAEITQLEIVLLGKPEYRVVGAAERLDILENLVSEIVKDRKSERDKLKGLQIGLGLTIATSGGTLVTLLSQVFG